MVSKQLVDLCGARNSVHILAVIHAKVKTFEVRFSLVLSKKSSEGSKAQYPGVVLIVSIVFQK